MPVQEVGKGDAPAARRENRRGVREVGEEKIQPCFAALLLLS